MINPAQSAILRSLCFHEAWHYAPTKAELIQMLDVGDAPVVKEDVVAAYTQLIEQRSIVEKEGRVAFAGSLEAHLQKIRERDIFQPRKRRRALIVARWLVRLGGVRFVALANTTALGVARDEGDLDFFVVTRSGSIWSTRLLAVLPFKLLGWMPTTEDHRDAVCLSYFITERGMDLSSHTLTPDDPYFRHWFLSLLPLYDDGISHELWKQNTAIRARHPFAETWIPPPDLMLNAPWFQLPTWIFEPLARRIQHRWFPSTIRELMNRDTRVIVTDNALKFHVTDARAEYRKKYEEYCKKQNIVS